MPFFTPQPSTIAFIIIGVMLVLYITEKLPIATTSILACMAFAIFGIVPFADAFSGFGNDIVFLICGMVVVGNALFETGVAQLMGKKIISVVGTNERVFIFAIMLVSVTLSVFLSNTATTAMMLPIAASSIGASGGKLSKKNTYMAIGIMSVAGGGLSLVGSTPQLIAQAALIEGGHDTMGFFELSKTGLPIVFLVLIFFTTLGYKLQQKVFTFPEVEEDIIQPAHPELEPPQKQSVLKMCISVAVLVFCTIGFITGLWSYGMVAMVGAAICVVTHCMPQKRVFQKMDWTTVVIMGCSFGIGTGLNKSGAGMLVAQGMMNLLGDKMSPWLLCAALALVAVILTNFMSSTATASLLIPISVLVASELGYDVKSVAMAVAIATNIGYATPISTPSMTMTLTAGYHFTDYVKIGGLINILAYGLVILLFPLVLNL